MNVKGDCISPDQVYDVLIVGAGPVGLATAIALRKRGINNILVIDQTRSFRRVGQVVDLLPNGLKAIKYIDEQAYQEITKNAFELTQPSGNNKSDNKIKARKRTWNYKNLQGKIVHSIPLDFEYWFNRYGEGRVPISWYDLQTTLRNLLPQEIVQANHRCVNFTQDHKYLQVDCLKGQEFSSNPFAHWETAKSEPIAINSPDKLENQEFDRQQFRAKLVVGADGINSTIRQVLYANSDLKQWAKPSYSGFAAIGCFPIDNLPDEIVRELEDKYFQGDPIVTLRNNSLKSDAQNFQQPRIMLISRQENTYGYIVHTPLSLDLIQNKSSEEIINLTIDILEKADFPPSVTKLVGLSTSEKLFQRPYYIHPADISLESKFIWSSGRLVLVGDAAHGMPPFAAQGANQGFEDAALISTLITKIINNNALDDQKIIAHEFTKYEQIRRPFMIKIQSATMENHTWLQEQWDNYSEMVYSRDLEQFISSFV